MSYNGSGTFLINTAGQPVVSGTVISSTAFNALTADLATGLSTAITKDGQTTVTANIPMGTYKFTGLGAGTAATDSANLSQVQSTVTKLLASVSGADTITAVGSPTLGAYAAGQMFYFIAAGDNTGAVTLNIDSLGAKSVTRDGSVALAAGDIKSGEVVVVVYDGTRFQVVSQINSSGNATFANVSITSALNVGGVSTLTGNVGIGTSPQDKLSVLTAQGLNTAANPVMTYGASTNWAAGFANIYDASYVDQFMLLNARMTGGTRAAPTFNANSPANGGIALKVDGLDGGLAIQTIPNGTGQSATTRLYLNPSGNLGLGTTSPGFRLDVQGSTGFVAAAFKSSYATVGYIGSDTSTVWFGAGGSAQQNNAFVVHPGSNYLAFYTNAANERARITAAGELCVGKTSNAASGSGLVLSNDAAYGGRIAFTRIDNSLTQYNAEFYTNGGTTVGTISTTSTATAYNISSDFRLKENIVPASDAGSVIDGIDVVQFDWKIGGHTRFGMIAQDLNEVAPEAVTAGDDGEEIERAWGVDYSKLVPMLVKEIQSLRARVAALEAK